jgi:site-specific DNA recombinase
MPARIIPDKRGKTVVTELGDDVRVGKYVRRSTDDDHQPYSIDAQDTRLDAYIASQPGWHLAARFADDASGATTTRPGLQQALAAARAGLIDVLLVYRVDRLSRSLRDTVTLLDDLDAAGVVFRSATEPFDTATPMGRMLVQMLGMFAQFERDTIIDRVIAGMERKAAQGKWKGGRRPYGYTVDKTTATLIPDPGEAAVIALIYDLYVQERLGGKNIAALLNQRGHRTTTGGIWSGHQVIRVLANRVYLGELTFRGATITGTHQPLIPAELFGQAAALLTARAQSPAHRAATGSDYLLTGRLRCPDCGKAMIGTRATGRTRTYRYYTCFTRGRYNTAACHAARIDADAADTAILHALAGFYARSDLIADAVTAARHAHQHASRHQHEELAAVTAELARLGQAADRYLTAFEHGTLAEGDVAARLAKLKDRTRQLRARHAELTATLAAQPHAPDPATLSEVTGHITQIITTGSTSHAKALVEALVERVAITGPDRLAPVFRIPQTTATARAAEQQDRTREEDMVRALRACPTGCVSDVA